MSERIRASEVKTAHQSKARRKTKVQKPVLRLLVVEDQCDLRTALQTFFSLLGHQARFVENVASALQAAREESFDVLLSDIGLPDGDGWDLLHQLEETGHRPSCAIAMSGYCLAEDIAKSKAAGFALHLIKPFPPEELEQFLATIGEPAS